MRLISKTCYLTGVPKLLHMPVYSVYTWVDLWLQLKYASAGALTPGNRGSIMLLLIPFYYCRATGLLSLADGSHMQGVFLLIPAVLEPGDWEQTARFRDSGETLQCKMCFLCVSNYCTLSSCMFTTMRLKKENILSNYWVSKAFITIKTIVTSLPLIQYYCLPQWLLLHTPDFYVVLLGKCYPY